MRLSGEAFLKKKAFHCYVRPPLEGFNNAGSSGQTLGTHWDWYTHRLFAKAGGPFQYLSRSETLYCLPMVLIFLWNRWSRVIINITCVFFCNAGGGKYTFHDEFFITIDFCKSFICTWTVHLINECYMAYRWERVRQSELLSGNYSSQCQWGKLEFTRATMYTIHYTAQCTRILVAVEIG